MPSFDVVSEVNMAELDNALTQAKKELDTRYDFKGAKASIERLPKNEVQIKANSEEKLGGLRELERVVPGSATWLLQEGQVRLEQVEVVRACMATRDARSVQIVPDRLACARAQDHTNKGQGRWR